MNNTNLVEIEKFKTRFAVRCKYNTKVLDIIHSIEKRYWNKDKIEWSLPMKAYDEFVKEISEAGFQVELKVSKPHAFITKNGNKVELKFVQWVNEFDQFKQLPNAEYDSKNQKLVFPETTLPQIINILNNNDMSYSKYDSELTNAEHSTKEETPNAEESTHAVKEEKGSTRKNANSSASTNKQKVSSRV